MLSAPDVCHPELNLRSEKYKTGIERKMALLTQLLMKEHPIANTQRTGAIKVAVSCSAKRHSKSSGQPDDVPNWRTARGRATTGRKVSSRFLPFAH